TMTTLERRTNGRYSRFEHGLVVPLQWAAGRLKRCGAAGQEHLDTMPDRQQTPISSWELDLDWLAMQNSSGQPRQVVVREYAVVASLEQNLHVKVNARRPGRSEKELDAAALGAPTG